MIHPKLTTITTALDEWCQTHNVLYDVVCDERDLQGIMLFRKDTAAISELLNDLAPIIREQGVFAQNKKIRGGNMLVFSIRSISESVMNRIISDTTPQTFAEKIEHAFNTTPAPAVPKPETPPDLLASARKIVEAQYKSATAGSFRNNQSSRQRQALTRDTTFGGREHPASPKANQKRKKFDKSLQEALEGLATPTDAQPQDLFAKFAKALTVLGDQLGIGPLQDRLKEQGIQWKQSDDHQNIILYIINATTNAPQPIARINMLTLDKPHDFEEQLTTMLDFAQGEAPGAFKQKQEQIRDQEKVVRDISQAVSPPKEEGEVSQQMHAGMTPEQTAAETAATPKPATPTAKPTKPTMSVPKPMAAAKSAMAKPTTTPNAVPKQRGRQLPTSKI